MTRSRTTALRLAAATATAAAVAVTALVPSAGASAREVAPHEVPRALATARAATAKYHDVSAAIADGFVPTDHCVASPAGGMGHHFVHPARMADGLSVAEPEVLLYERDQHGRMRLVGIEYIAVDADQDPSTVEHHQLAGQHFHGPKGGPGTGLPYHYLLHVWVWKHNPSGMFADWNPAVSC